MIRNLTSLRFIFIYLIYLSHVSYMGFPMFDFGGECGVAFFFTLSGFVLSVRYGKEIEDGSFRHSCFFWKQFSKLYPLHIVLTIIAVCLEFAYGNDIDLLKTIPSVFLLQCWIPDESFYFTGNAPSWFLGDILFMYIIFPAIYKWLGKSSVTVLLTTLAVLSIYIFVLTLIPERRYNDFVYLQPPLRMIDFALGILAYRLKPLFEKHVKTTGRAFSMEMMAIAIGVATFVIYPTLDRRISCASLFWLMDVAFILAFSVSDKLSTPFSKLLHWRPLLFCGSVTFEIYLLHAIVNWNEFVVLKNLELASDPFITTTVCILGTIFVSWLVKKYFVDKTAKPLYDVIMKKCLV